MSYASSTSVSVAKTRGELESLLRNAGASQFVSGWDSERAAIGFVLADRHIRFELPLPDPDASRFWKTPSRGQRRTREQAMKSWEQECRSCWRTLFLTVKAKLAAIDRGISTFEAEFLAWTVIPGTTRTVLEEIGEPLRESLRSGEAPRLLLGGGS